MRGEMANKRFPLGEAPLWLGRNPDNTVVLSGGRASRRHAEIRRDGAGYVLSDLGSANGTFVNGQRLTAPHRLRPGTTIEIGDDAFRFEAPPAATDATIVAAPAPPVAPPTVPAGQGGTQRVPGFQLPPATPPAPPPPATPVPGAYVGSLPSTPASAPSAPAKRGGIGRTLLIALGLIGLVLVAACVGGAMLLTRAGSLASSNPTAAPAARTPQPTQPSGEEPTAPGSSDSAPTSAPAADGAAWTI